MSFASDLSRPSFAPWAVGAGVVATAGLAALDPDTLKPLCEDFGGQVNWVLDRLDAVLIEAGSHRGAVLRIECFLADRELFGAWDEAFSRRFGPQPPARTTLICTLAVEGLLVEVQALAALASETPTPGRRCP